MSQCIIIVAIIKNASHHHDQIDMTFIIMIVET